MIMQEPNLREHHLSILPGCTANLPREDCAKCWFLDRFGCVVYNPFPQLLLSSSSSSSSPLQGTTYNLTTRPTQSAVQKWQTKQSIKVNQPFAHLHCVSAHMCLTLLSAQIFSQSSTLWDLLSTYERSSSDHHQRMIHDDYAERVASIDTMLGLLVREFSRMNRYVNSDDVWDAFADRLVRQIARVI
jgi:hypothetical protein